MTTTIGQFQRHLNEFTTANASTALTIDFQANGNTQAIPLTAANCVLTFNNPRVHTKLILRFIQDSVGNRTIIFPISVVGAIPALNLTSNTSTTYELYFNGINYYFTTSTIGNGNALTGQALIYDGYNWTAGGGGQATDNYVGAVNLKTDGYVSAQSIKLPAGLSITSRNVANSADLTVYTSTVSINNTQTFGDSSNSTTVINSGGAGTQGINLSPGGVQRLSISSALVLANVPQVSFVGAGLLNIFDFITSTPQVGGAFTVSSQNVIGNSSVGGKLILKGGNVTGINGVGGQVNIASGTGNPLDPNINASDGYLTLSRGNNIVAQWTDGYSDFISFGNKFNPSSTSGNIRLPRGSSTITSLAINGINNLAVYSSSTSLANVQTFGDINNSTTIIASGSVGGAGINLSPGGVQRFSVSSILTLINTPSMSFATAATFNIIDLTSATPQTGSLLTISGQNVIANNSIAGKLLLKGGDITGTNGLGGAVGISSGVGNPLDPNINASDGYITISRGVNAVASWTDGYSDFISLAKTGLSAQSGNIRLAKNGTIVSRNFNNSGDYIAYQGPTTNVGFQTFGDITNGSTIIQSGAGINISPLGVARLSVSSTLVLAEVPSLYLDNTLGNGNVLFAHLPNTGGNSNNFSFTIAGQDRSNLTSRGGAVTLRTGTGNPLDPNINSSDGYLTISRGNNIVASWTDGYSDFMSFGSKFNPSSTTGNIRLPTNGSISARNVANSADSQLLFKSGSTTVINGESQIAGVSLAGNGATLFSVSNTGSQSVMTLNDGTVSIMQFTGSGTLSSATLQIHSTAATTGSSLIISGQPANINGGPLYLGSGNSTNGTGPQGRLALSLGGFVNGVSSGASIQMVELANMGTSNTANSVLSLCSSLSFSTTQVNGSPGNNVMYLGQVITKPPINPTTGILLYSGFNGEFAGRSPTGDFKVGDGYLPMTINGAQNISLIAAASSYQSMAGGLFVGNDTTNPTGNPTSGIYMYVNSGTLSARGTSGTITILAVP